MADKLEIRPPVLPPRFSWGSQLLLGEHQGELTLMVLRSDGQLVQARTLVTDKDGSPDDRVAAVDAAMDEMAQHVWRSPTEEKDQARGGDL